MAYFYDEKDDGCRGNWEDAGGLNAHLLEEMRNAMIDVEGEVPCPVVSPAQAAVIDWIKRIPAFDFPDDEIG